MLRASLCASDDELVQILQLNKSNHRTVLSDAEKTDSGFLTLLYSLELLQQLQKLTPAVIVKDGDTVVGYALAVSREGANVDHHLQAMVGQLDAVIYLGKPLLEYRYYIMGQICVHPNYRGKGIVQMIYYGHRTFYGDRFDMLATDIATSNQRSLRAHLRTGFKAIHRYRDSMDEWQVVLWTWR